MKPNTAHPFSIAVFLGAAYVGGACGRGSSSGGDPDGSRSPAVLEIGVAECDDYVSKVHRCITDRVPADRKKAFEEDLARSRSAWAALAANPGAKPALGQSCRLALERVRVNMKAFSCEW